MWHLMPRKFRGAGAKYAFLCSQLCLVVFSYGLHNQHV